MSMETGFDVIEDRVWSQWSVLFLIIEVIMAKKLKEKWETIEKIVLNKLYKKVFYDWLKSRRR